MSLDAGGLAQMTYNHHNSLAHHALGVPGSGFASRGKGSNIKRLSVAPPSQISTIDETQQANPNPTPRTSRSHLLAGLRTAPKSPTFPSSAPPNSLHHHFGNEQSRYLNRETQKRSHGMPQTAVGANFTSNHRERYSLHGNSQMYSLPEQVLAPPAVQIGGEPGDGNMDPDLYAELLATNQYLAQQQMRLQQQLIHVTAAAQQFQNMNIAGGMSQQQQYFQYPMATHSGYYNPQIQSGIQPIIHAVPNQPGLYSVYNPINGQHGYVMDNVSQAGPASPQSLANHDLSHSPPPLTPTFRAQVSPPPEPTALPSQIRNHSPPKSISPPVEVNPLPPPSANAFRPSHKKNSSYVSGFGEQTSSPIEGLKSALPKSAGFPQTPMTGTFGPGQSRAGEHPVRQPRGPPSLEELVARPTASHEGSKNFATRQRRRAVNNLVRAGIERRGASRGSGSIDSIGSMTPASETEITFSVSSDNDSESSLSGKPSLGSLRAASIGAIGSERKEMRDRSRDRNSSGSQFTATSVSSEEGPIVGGNLVEIKIDEPKQADDRRMTPLLVLTNAEKRKSSIF